MCQLWVTLVIDCPLFVLIVNSIGHKFLHIAPLETKQTLNVEIVYTFKFYDYVAVHSWNKIWFHKEFPWKKCSNQSQRYTERAFSYVLSCKLAYRQILCRSAVHWRKNFFGHGRTSSSFIWWVCYLPIISESFPQFSAENWINN